MSNLEIEELAKQFGSRRVVDRVSFQIDNGEFFVLLGPSGGGKTTILRMICGLEQPDAGKIVLNGQDITKLSPRQRNLGMVFQDYGLYPTMDVYGNIAYGLETRHVPRAEIQKRVPQAAEMLGLTPLLRRSITDLSGGEQQRVALARILARDADAFLFDEPLSNLDPKLRYQARRDIVKVHRAKQKPSIYVTHDQTEAFALGDRIAIMAEGHLQQIGSPDELLEAPANIFVARFIGSPPMNLLAAELCYQDSQYTVQMASKSFVLPERWNPTLQAYSGESGVLLGIRPHAIIPEWQFASLDYEPLVLAAEILESEVLIGEIAARLKLSSGATLDAIWPESENPPSRGEYVKISINPEMFCLFDPLNEQALQSVRTAP